MTASQLELRRVYGAYPTGVAALATLVDGVPVGMAANSFTSVSLDPPLVSVCVAHTSTTWPVLRSAAERGAHVGISVLAADQVEVSKRLAARDVDRFAELAWRASEDGCVLIDGSSAWFDCTIGQQVRAGDHDIVVFAVHDLAVEHDAPPLVFHASTYRSLS